jgi:hypothetical protein
VAGLLVPHAAMRQAVQFFVDQRDQPVQRGSITASPRLQ